MSPILELCERRKTLTNHMAAATSHTSRRDFVLLASSVDFPSLDATSYSLDYLYSSSYNSYNLSCIVDGG